MEIPEYVNQKFRQTFGAETTEFIVTWMDEIQRHRGDITELRRDVQADIAELRHEMQIGFARLETMIERSKSDLMKWSFAFWVGAVLSIAVLAKVLR